MNANFKMQSAKIDNECRVQNAKCEKLSQVDLGWGAVDNLSDRFEDWAVEIIKLSAKLSKTFVGRHIGGQLVRSATSAGANYEEACGGESRSDFIHKLQIVLKEMKESLYWLRLIFKAELLPKESQSHLL